MTLVTLELHKRVMNHIYDILDKADKIYPGNGFSTLVTPVTYRTDMKTTAGFAYPSLKRIELNATIFLANIENFFDDTIPHELAHILTRMLYPTAKQSHGPEWKSVMRNLGFSPTRCHSYDVTSINRDNAKLSRYTCQCNDGTKEFFLSKILHNKINKGHFRICVTCKTRIIFTPL